MKDSSSTLERTAMRFFQPIRFVPYGTICCITGVTGFVLALVAVALSPNTLSLTSQILLYIAATAAAVFVMTAVTLACYEQSYRVLLSDRKNPFLAEITELIQLNRKLMGRPGDAAGEERKRLEEKISELRKWPNEYSKKELASITSSYLKQTASDRKLALTSADEKLSEYTRIAEERRRALEA